MDYIELINYCYNEYKESWGESRGYELSGCDPEDGFDGECFVTLTEFEQWEFQNEDCMKPLLSKEIFAVWQSRDELKLAMAKQRIEERYKEQRAGNFYSCPRCGCGMSPKLSYNALSRRTDVYICSMCGTQEAVEDYPFSSPPKIPLTEWFIAKLEPYGTAYNPNSPAEEKVRNNAEWEAILSLAKVIGDYNMQKGSIDERYLPYVREVAMVLYDEGYRKAEPSEK